LNVKSGVENYILKSDKISKHSFSPLIYKEIKQRRYKLTEHNDTQKRSHKKIVKGKTESNTKIRKILYSTHIDSHIYSYYAKKIISPAYEDYLIENKNLSDSITAYRQIKADDNLKYKNNINFASDVFQEIKKRQNCTALVFDVENFFPSLNHSILKNSWAKIINKKSLPKDHYNLFKSITNFSYVKLSDLKNHKSHFDEKKLSDNRKNGNHTFFNNTKELIDSNIIIHKNQQLNISKKLVGIPQGLPISALLANIYMLSFDEAIINNLPNCFYRRYSDDIIIICENHETENVRSIVSKEIKQLDIKISEEKTEVTHFEQKERLESYKFDSFGIRKNAPLSYLGFDFYGYKTLIKSNNIAKFYRNMKYLVKTKHKRCETLNEKNLTDNSFIFKRKLYRLYSYKGIKSRKLDTKRTIYIGNKKITKNTTKKFRGNYFKYAYRASEELEAPEIKKQLKNHWKIIQKTMIKYDFSNQQ
jgi:hypothetical protein